MLAIESPVVIMSRGHSGTRVLAWAIEKLGIRLGATTEVPTGDVQDRRFSGTIKRVCRASLEKPPTAEPNPRLLRIFQRSLTDYLQWLGDYDGGWGWKFPETYLIPNYVAATFPKARYIELIRDGRDLAFKYHLTDNPKRRLGRRLLRHLDALDKPHHIQAAMSWDFQIRRFDAFVKATNLPVHRVNFETFCQQPVETMEAICEFLGVSMTDECRTYLLEEIQPGKVRQHRDETNEQVAEVEATILPTLVRLGYVEQP